MKPKILVTSAAGHTGAAVVAALRKQDFPVRALVRRRDSRAERLENAGAEVVVADQLDIRDIRKSLVGVERAYHCPPFGPNTLQGATLFAVAAEEAGLEVVVQMNAWNPHPSHPAIHQREQWLAERVYRWMPGVDVIQLNPGLFAFPYFLGIAAAAHFGTLMLPFGDGRNAPPSNEDIAAVAAGVLADPAPHIGKRYRPTGPRLVSGHDVAEVLDRVLGRGVAYRDIPTWMFVKAALAQGISRFEVSQIRRYAEEVRAGAYEVGAPTDCVERVCGRPAEDFETTARRYVLQPGRVRDGLTIGSRLGALAAMVKTLATRVPDLDRWEAERDHPVLRDAELAHESQEWLADHATDHDAAGAQSAA